MYEVFSTRKGLVVQYVNRGKAEYVGADQCWVTQPENATPFDSVGHADGAIDFLIAADIHRSF